MVYKMTNIQRLKNSIISLEKKVTIINDKFKKKDNNTLIKNTMNVEKKINLNDLQLEILNLKKKQKNLNLLFNILILLFISYIFLTIKL